MLVEAINQENFTLSIFSQVPSMRSVGDENLFKTSCQSQSRWAGQHARYSTDFFFYPPITANLDFDILFRHTRAFGANAPSSVAFNFRGKGVPKIPLIKIAQNTGIFGPKTPFSHFSAIFGPFYGLLCPILTYFIYKHRF